MRLACIAGRNASLAGRIPKKLYATASSPEAGTIVSHALCEESRSASGTYQKRRKNRPRDAKTPDLGPKLDL